MDADAFADALYRSLARRKVELTAIRLFIESRSLDSSLGADWVVRSAAVLVYAHWEGFVKESSVLYIKYVNAQRIIVNSLKPSFQAASLRGHFKRAEGTQKFGYLGSILTEMDAVRCDICFLDPSKVVNTESNLSSEVFKEIVGALGLDYCPEYETREAFINAKILLARHSVAHGELVRYSDEETFERIDGILILLDRFTEQLVEAVRDSAFLLN